MKVSLMRRRALMKIFHAMVIFSMVLNMSFLGIFFSEPKVVSATIDPNCGTLWSDDFKSGFSAWDTSVGAKWSLDGNEGNPKSSVKAIDDTGTSNDYIYKKVSTAGKKDITLYYEYKAKTLETGDFVIVEWSKNGTDNWQTLYTVDKNNDNNSTWQSKNHVLSGSSNQSNLTIRFRSNLDKTSGDNGDQVNFDNISIYACGVCVDNDKDGYSSNGGSCGVIDCNDNDAGIKPGATEDCDGIDNNCNGNTDENLTPKFNVKQSGVCVDTFQVCAGLAGWQNNYAGVTNYESEEVTCDGLDNDCDGQNDEELTGGLTALQVGVCAGALQTCDGAKGWYDNYALVGNYESDEGTAKGCDNLDNDCDGTTDESYDVGAGCNNELKGACYRTGVKVCGDDGTVCNAEIIEPGVEVCGNDIDENCDGSLIDACECETGATAPCGQTDVGACAFGEKTCVSGSWGECVGEVKPAKEDCGSQTDENCDGKTEECERPIKVTATKIVCDDESLLPDWHGKSGKIDENTVSDFFADLDDKTSCHLQGGWQFQWSSTGQANPGDDRGVVEGFNTTEPTDSETGQTSFTINGASEIRVREAMKDNYLEFSGIDGGNNSAEMWCHEDMAYYDNYDYVRINKKDKSKDYYCVAFNVSTAPACDETISGHKFNGNSEAPLEDWEIQLKNGDATIATTTTNSDGYYEFKDLCDGTYTVHEVMQRGWRQVSPYNGDGGNDYYTVTLPENTDAKMVTGDNVPEKTEYNFVNEAGICGYKYNFKTEKTVSAWPIYLKTQTLSVEKKLVNFPIVPHPDELKTKTPSEEQTSLPYTNIDETITDLGGEYCFFPEPGNYRVEEKIGGEWAYGDWTVADGSMRYYDITLENDEPKFVDFWNNPPATCELGPVELINPSFQYPDTGSWYIYNQTQTGWTHSDGLEIQDATLFDVGTSSTNQYAELDGNNSMSISQQVETIVGASYKVSYDFSPRPGHPDNKLQVYINGKFVDEMSGDGSANTNNVWTTGSYTFEATGTLTTIGFADGSKSDSLGTFLDNVKLELVKCQSNPTSICGDGERSGEEQCDDGNVVDGDGCSANCTNEVIDESFCGDGVKKGNEECDDGNQINGDGCSSSCIITGSFSSSGGGNGYIPDTLSNVQFAMQCQGSTVGMMVSWLTSSKGASRVVYDTVSHKEIGGATAPNYGYAFSTVEDPALVTGHSVSISGLKPETVYYFRAVSVGSGQVLGEEKILTDTLTCQPGTEQDKVIVLGEEGEPILGIAKSVGVSMANAGDKNIKYKVTINNGGNLDAFDVKVVDVLPTGLVFADGGLQEKTWQFDSIKAGEKKVIEYLVNVSSTATAKVYTNKATASASNHQPVSATADLDVRNISVLAETGMRYTELFLLVSVMIGLYGASRYMRKKSI